MTSNAALRWMIGGEWRAHPARVILAALAIAIGVALGFAVHLVNQSALNEFSRAVSAVNGDADLQIRGTGPDGFGEALYPILARQSGIAAASPVIELSGEAAGHRLTLLGIDPLRAAAVTPGLLGRADPALGVSPLDDHAVYLSAATLREIQLAVGDRMDLSAHGERANFRIAGTLPGAGTEQSIAVIDIAAAQARFGELGRLQRIDLKLRAGADPQAVRREIAAILPADAEIVTQETVARRSDALSRAYRVNLDMLALMALLTGGFLVYSAQALSVARRRRHFALLRVIGAGRRTILMQVMAEAAILGTIGGLVGLALGLGLAGAALALVGGDLGGGYFGGAHPALVLAPGTAAVFLGLGIATSMLGSILPAVEAANAVPAIAIKDSGDAVDPRHVPASWPGLILLGSGGLAALAPAIYGLPLLGYLAMALLLAGGVAVMPPVARLLLGVLDRTSAGSVMLDLAVKRLWGAPSQAAVALCGIVASTSLMIAMAVMVASFRGSVDDWLGQILSADLYLRLDGEGPGFDPALQQRLATLPGIAGIRFLKTTSLSLAADKPPLALIIRSVPVADPASVLPLIGEPVDVPAAAMPVWVSEPAQWLYQWHKGDTVALPIADRSGSGKPAEAVVAGIWRDYARQNGAIVLDDRDFINLTGDAARDSASVTLAPKTDIQAVTAAIKAVLPPEQVLHLVVAEPRTLRQFALKLFDRSFAVTYLLEAIAILVGLAGVAATVSAQTLARRREFGMLRHIGVRRRQITVMLMAEGALLGAVGGVSGIGLGLVMSAVLIQVVNPQSFHWTMATKLPLGLMALVLAALVLAASGTARLAGGRALAAEAVLAVREDA
jgi:putative ABC transport system permease protein